MASSRANESPVSDSYSPEVSKSSKKLGSLFNSNTWRIYVSHTLTSWGDRMWAFAVGLFLVVLFPESLQYTAIYGFTTCISVIIGGSFIGKWVDKSSRLKAATVAIVVQNLAVILCAVILILMIYYREDLLAVWNGKTEYLFLAAIILFAVIGELASVASKIAIEKDWIVVLAQKDEGKLSKMNSTMRTIDLTTLILAPAVVAQITHFISNIAGAAFIAAWNLVSGTIEIYLLCQIFKSFPELAQDKEAEEKTSVTGILDVATAEFDGLEDIKGGRDHKTTNYGSITMTTVDHTVAQSRDILFQKEDKQSKWHFSKRVAESLNGWKDYFRNPLKFAGVGLAMLYMTVLGFDSITIGYMYSQGVSESLIGVLMAVGAVSGILGSLSFPFLRRKLGKCAIGVFGFGFETVALVLCVISIFLPGSPFDPESLWSTSKSDERDLANSSKVSPGQENSKDYTIYLSVILFSVGILISRYGLWIADLSVTQFFQEEVPEAQRGILNGVQDSLNQALNLIKFVLVIVLPDPGTFGYLIILSWLFTLFGWICFIVFSCSWKGRLRKNIGAYLHL